MIQPFPPHTDTGTYYTKPSRRQMCSFMSLNIFLNLRFYFPMQDGQYHLSTKNYEAFKKRHTQVKTIYCQDTKPSTEPDSDMYRC